MQHATTRSLFNYWNDVRGGRMAPRRLEIEPARISAFLSETMILEREGEHSLRFRLAGTRICEVFGREMRGLSFIDLWPEADRLEITKDMASCLQGAAVELRFEGSTARDMSCPFEAVILPLMHTGENVDRYLGAIVPTTAPYWLGSEPITTLSLQACEIIWPVRNATWQEQPRAEIATVMHDLHGARNVYALGRRFRVLDGGLTKQK